MRLTAAAALTAVLAGAGASRADAQTNFQRREPGSRGFISANAVFQITASSFTDRFEFQEFVETGSIETSFETKPALGIDASGGIRLWRNIGVGLGFATHSPGSKGGGAVTARIPHPFQFGQHREVSGSAGLERKETAIHGSVLYFVPSRSRLTAVLGAGATFFQADQTFVSDVLYDHVYPYDEATFRGVVHDSESASGIGFHASLDLGWRFTRALGAGAIVRYSHGSLPFKPGSREVKIDVGGLQAGAGLRVTF